MTANKLARTSKNSQKLKEDTTTGARNSRILIFD